MSDEEQDRADTHNDDPSLPGLRADPVVGVFPNPAALLRLAGAVLVEAHDEWAATDRRYLSEHSMAQLAAMTTLTTLAEQEVDHTELLTA
jgi:putative transposase